MFQRWQPQVKEYYWEVNNATSASLSRFSLIYAGPTKIHYSSSNANYDSGLIGTIDLTQSTPTTTSTPGFLYMDSGMDGDATHAYSYGWLKASSGFYAYRGVTDTTTDTLVVADFDATSYPTQPRGVMAVMVGDTIVWTTSNMRGGSPSMITDYIYSGTTLLHSETATGGHSYAILGKPTSTTVSANAINSGYLVTTTTATSMGARYAGFYLGGENYSVTSSSNVNTPNSLTKYNSSRGVDWTYNCYGGPTGDEAMYGIVLGKYKTKVYIVVGPKDSASTTSTLELVELDAATGNELNRMFLPVPQIVQNGVVSAYRVTYVMNNYRHAFIDSKNGYFAVPLTESADFNGYISSSVGYHDWFLIRVPE